MPWQAVQELIDAGGITPSPGHVGGLSLAHAVYDFTVDGGLVGPIVPAETVLLPAGAILLGGVVFVETAVVGTVSTLAVGTTAGSSASALLAATAEATLGTDDIVPLVPTNAVPVRLTAAGSINVTVGTAALTAGKVHIYALFIAG